MEIVRCEKGHFYDANVNQSCPQCAVEARGGYGLGGFGQPAPPAPPKVPMPGISPLSPTEPVSPPLMEIGATVPVTNRGFSPEDFGAAPARPSEPVPPTSRGEGFDNFPWAPAEPPRSGQPVPEFPRSGQPAADFPRSVQPAPEFPRSEQPAADYPRSVQPAPEFPRSEQPAADYPRSVQPAPEFPRSEQPAADYPRSVQPAPEFPRSEQPAADYPRSVQPAPEPVAPAAAEPDVHETPTNASNPVVGWLVGIEGPDKGKDYHLHNGYNYIGRTRSMDIRLTDETVSAENAALIGYDDQEKMFSFAPAGGRGIVRANDRMVIGAAQLEAYDKLTIGATKLLFIPLCGERFNWDE